MGRTACTEPQCLYKGDHYLPYLMTRLIQEEYSLSTSTDVQLMELSY